MVGDVAHQIQEPTSMTEALTGQQAQEWKRAADLEYQALIENETWDLTELPEGDSNWKSLDSETHK